MEMSDENKKSSEDRKLPDEHSSILSQIGQCYRRHPSECQTKLSDKARFHEAEPYQFFTILQPLAMEKYFSVTHEADLMEIIDEVFQERGIFPKRGGNPLGRPH